MTKSSSVVANISQQSTQKVSQSQPKYRKCPKATISHMSSDGTMAKWLKIAQWSQ